MESRHSHWKSIQDGGGHHFEFRFGGILWAWVKIFPPNLVQWWRNCSLRRYMGQ